MNGELVTHSAEQMASLKRLTMIVYILYALAYFAGISAIVGIIINYVKREEVAGTWLESHFRWQMDTFWFGLLWAIIGIATALFGVGVIILFANCIWIIYRVIKGWLYFNDSKPIPA